MSENMLKECGEKVEFDWYCVIAEKGEALS